ncbi:MAG TPA: alanine racemase [Acidimicrobiia bacterium]|nr:alanine racemase [Acidimicrobiia bacterium]
MNHSARPDTGLKGLPFGFTGGIGWDVFDTDLGFPVALLHESALRHNSATIAAFCARHGVSHAPHGKTTMAPAIFRIQLDDGSWAITAATVWQAAMMRAAGVPRVLIANQVVVPAEIEWLGAAVAAEFDVLCYVDSLAGVRLLSDVLGGLPGSPRLPVLLEVGAPGGRTGVRSLEEALAVARATVASPQLLLTGVSGFEGILDAEGDRTAAEVVVDFLDRVVEAAHALHHEGLFEPSPEVIVTAGGSAYFDHVVDRFSRLDLGDVPARVVLRTGGYISHDDVGYHWTSPMGASPRVDDQFRLQPAIEVWGAVLSRPEPTRALVGLGKRDAASDGRLPVAKKVRRLGSSRVEEIAPIQVAVINDQHSYLDLHPDDSLAVGDLVGFGIGHPCTTFDKWRVLLMVDDDYRVTELVHTVF